MSRIFWVLPKTQKLDVQEIQGAIERNIMTDYFRLRQGELTAKTC